MLNATYEPLSVVPSRRAACLVLADKADIIEDDGTHLHSESLSVPNPVVIRLRYVVKVPYHRRTAMSRRAVFVRDEHSLPVLRRHGRLDRPHHAEVPRRSAHLGERRGGVPAVQPSQARPHARRGRHAPGQAATRPEGTGLDHGVGQPRAGGLEAVSRCSPVDDAVVARRHVDGRRRRVPRQRAARRTNGSRRSPRPTADAGVGLVAARRVGRQRVPRLGKASTSSAGGPVAVACCCGPGEFVWLDLEIPDGDELWSDDVGAAMWWVGELWRAALADVEPQPRVHRGRLHTHPLVVGHLLRRHRPRRGLRRRRQAGGDLATAHASRRQVPDDGAPALAPRRRRLAGRRLAGRWHPSADELAPLVKTVHRPPRQSPTRLTEALEQAEACRSSERRRQRSSRVKLGSEYQTRQG